MSDDKLTRADLAGESPELVAHLLRTGKLDDVLGTPTQGAPGSGDGNAKDRAWLEAATPEQVQRALAAGELDGILRS